MGKLNIDDLVIGKLYCHDFGDNFSLYHGKKIIYLEDGEPFLLIGKEVYTRTFARPNDIRLDIILKDGSKTWFVARTDNIIEWKNKQT